jgi:hypothetical protein
MCHAFAKRLVPGCLWAWVGSDPFLSEFSGNFVTIMEDSGPSITKTHHMQLIVYNSSNQVSVFTYRASANGAWCLLSVLYQAPLSHRSLSRSIPPYSCGDGASMVSKQTSEEPRLLLNGVLQYASDRLASLLPEVPSPRFSFRRRKVGKGDGDNEICIC